MQSAEQVSPLLSAAPERVERSTLRCAVVGCGYWGPNHLRVLSQQPPHEPRANNAIPAIISTTRSPLGSLPGAPVAQVELTAVDHDPQRLDWVAEHFPGVRREPDLSAVLDDPQIEAVVIATPTATHSEIVSAALRAGKHVLCEKPLCTEADEAEELVSLAEHVERVLMTGHTFLFNPGLEVLKGLIDSGELGELRYLASTRTNLGPIRSDVNVVYDLASHDVSIFNWLFGELPESVAAMGQAWVQTGIEDVSFVHLRYSQGRLASVQASWLDPKKVRQLTVVGSRRMATWDDLDRTSPVAIYDRGARAAREESGNDRLPKPTTWDGEVRLPQVPVIEPLRAQDESFLRAVRTGRVERSHGPFSADVVLVLSAICESLRQEGACVPVIRQRDRVSPLPQTTKAQPAAS